MANILIIGCGSIGTQLANQLAAQGHTVTGIKRSPPQAEAAFQYLSVDIASVAAIKQLSLPVDIVFFIVSADGRTEQSYRAVYDIGLENVLSKFSTQPWFFVSSTSVYGQSQGEWVDEDSPTEPVNITSQLMLAAEQRVLATNTNNVVVRFSGIYGPGRDYLLRTAKQSPEIQQTPAYYTNRIHSTDCVRVLAFLLQQRLQNHTLESCYLASDNHPAPLWEVMAWLAERLSCPQPTMKAVSKPADCNKRCRNQRLKDLGFQFRYASYQEGYGEMLA